MVFIISSEFGKSLVRQVKESLAGKDLTPVDMLVVLAEYQQEMGEFFTQASSQGRRWLDEQGLRAEASIQAIRYI